MYKDKPFSLHACIWSTFTHMYMKCIKINQKNWDYPNLRQLCSVKPSSPLENETPYERTRISPEIYPVNTRRHIDVQVSSARMGKVIHVATLIYRQDYWVHTCTCVHCSYVCIFRILSKARAISPLRQNMVFVLSKSCINSVCITHNKCVCLISHRKLCRTPRSLVDAQDVLCDSCSRHTSIVFIRYCLECHVVWASIFIFCRRAWSIEVLMLD